MLAGRPAFLGDTPSATMAAILTGQPVPLRDLLPELPPAVSKVVATCLAKRPDDRWPSADAVADALGKLKTRTRPPQRRASAAGCRRPDAAENLGLDRLPRRLDIEADRHPNRLAGRAGARRPRRNRRGRAACRPRRPQSAVRVGCRRGARRAAPIDRRPGFPQFFRPCRRRVAVDRIRGDAHHGADGRRADSRDSRRERRADEDRAEADGHGRLFAGHPRAHQKESRFGPDRGRILRGHRHAAGWPGASRSSRAGHAVQARRWRRSATPEARTISSASYRRLAAMCGAPSA